MLKYIIYSASSLSLKLQQDGLTLPMALQLCLIGMETQAEENLENFTGTVEGDVFKEVQLQGVTDETLNNFNRSIDTMVFRALALV